MKPERTPDFSVVTEIPGDEVTIEQIERLAHRYCWAATYCRDKDALEVACGAGQGLGYLATVARTLRAGDISPALVARAQAHYGHRVDITEMDAQQLPVLDKSLDVVMLFEAIYYLPSAESFVQECRRVLRSGGQALIVTANKDLYDFNPSPFSHRYLGVVELSELLVAHGFSCQFFGVTSIKSVSTRQRALRPIKMLAAKLGLIPKTMAGKKFLKRLVFGDMRRMPEELDSDTIRYVAPTPIPQGIPNREYKVIYVAATSQDKTQGVLSRYTIDR